MTLKGLDILLTTGFLIDVSRFFQLDTEHEEEIALRGDSEGDAATSAELTSVEQNFLTTMACSFCEGDAHNHQIPDPMNSVTAKLTMDLVSLHMLESQYESTTRALILRASGSALYQSREDTQFGAVNFSKLNGVSTIYGLKGAPTTMVIPNTAIQLVFKQAENPASLHVSAECLAFTIHLTYADVRFLSAFMAAVAEAQGTRDAEVTWDQSVRPLGTSKVGHLNTSLHKLLLFLYDYPGL